MNTTIDLNTLNVWPECKVRVIVEKNDKLYFHTVAIVPYTPNAIQTALHELCLSGAWVESLLGREYIDAK